jgi:hypothetical protein
MSVVVIVRVVSLSTDAACTPEKLFATGKIASDINASKKLAARNPEI